MPTRRKCVKAEKTKAIATKVNNAKENKAKISDSDNVEANEKMIERKATSKRVRLIDKSSKSPPKEEEKEKKKHLKFDSVIIKVGEREIISIPEFPDIRIKLVKGGKHPYLCPKCDSGFWTKSAYEAHIPVHILKKPKQPVKKFRCDICAKEFSKLCDVERHTRVHTGEKPCICNICNKRFQQAHNLSKHLLTHLHIKPFHCEICNKQFGRNDVLRRHLLTHSVDKPIKCTVCHRGFIRASQLLQHMRRKHPDVPIDLSELNVDDTDGRDERLYGTDFDDHRPGSSRQMKQEA